MPWLESHVATVHFDRKLPYFPSLSLLVIIIMSSALTQIRNADAASRKEVELGIQVGKGSWHDTFSHSAYCYVGGLPLELTEGDILAICSQFGELVHVDLCRDEETGKSKGFAFIAYEDQRSTVLAVDNLSGAKVGGRTLNVQHVGNYRKKKEELGMTVEDGGEVASSSSSSSEEDEPEEQAPPASSAPVPSWRDLVARRDATLKAKEEDEKRKKRRGGERGDRGGRHKRQRDDMTAKTTTKKDRWKA